MAGSGTAHLQASPLLRVEHLVVTYRLPGRGAVQAVSDVSLDVARGETLGLVGESGCGKSSTGKAIMRFHRATSGSVELDGIDLLAARPRELRRLRRRFQMIFQDPFSSLNPRRRVGDIVGEGLPVSGIEQPWQPRINEALRAVGLDPEAVADRRPYELSGGQAQRVALARALVLEPELLVCDEPVSALDVSVQAQILNLLEELKERYELTMLFVAHDLAVVKSISDRVAVMYLGKLCEIAPSDDLYAAPRHPYTAMLLASILPPDPGVQLASAAPTGELPSPLDPPSGCRFRTRCPHATERCELEEPIIRAIGPGTGHFVACHHPV